MDCPFYLVIGNYRIGDSVSYSDSLAVNTEEVDIGNVDAIKEVFLQSLPRDVNEIVLDSLLVISNNTAGAPFIVHHWA